MIERVPDAAPPPKYAGECAVCRQRYVCGADDTAWVEVGGLRTYVRVLLCPTKLRWGTCGYGISVAPVAPVAPVGGEA